MGSSDSLSLASEPPDIAKWFSSYVYESPQLNSIDDFRDSGRPRLAETGKSYEEKKVVENDMLEKAHDVLLACEKNTSDAILQSKSIARLDKCKIKVMKDSEPLSLPSEPPDIRNWFSSYVYESPAIDTSTEFRSNPHGNEFNEDTIDTRWKEEKLTQATQTVQKNDLKGQKTSSGLVRCTDSGGEKEYKHVCFPKETLKAGRNKYSSVCNELASQRHPEQILHLKRVQECGKDLGEDIELSFQNGGSPVDASISKFSAEAGHMLLNVKSKLDKKLGNFLDEPIQSRVQTEESNLSEHFSNKRVAHSRLPSENLQHFNLVDGKPVYKNIGGHDNKENARTGFSESGFISTRRSKQCDARGSCKGPLEGKPYSSMNPMTVPPTSNKEATAARKVLLETTNFQGPNMLEVIGKWRCPQKNKPNLGPPLKQLRLEQWVRRV